MSKLESIKERMKPFEEIDEDYCVSNEDVNYLLQRLERYETTLQKITHTTTHMQAKFFAQEALRE